MKKYSKPELELLFNSDDTQIVTDAILYSTFNIDDYEWIQEKCLQLLNNSDEDIASLAITCLGHIARIYSKINESKVIPALQQKATDPCFAGRVEDALDDINMFALKE